MAGNSSRSNLSYDQILNQIHSSIHDYFTSGIRNSIPESERPRIDNAVDSFAAYLTRVQSTPRDLQAPARDAVDVANRMALVMGEVLAGRDVGDLLDTASPDAQVEYITLGEALNSLKQIQSQPSQFAELAIREGIISPDERAEFLSMIDHRINVMEQHRSGIYTLGRGLIMAEA